MTTIWVLLGVVVYFGSCAACYLFGFGDGNYEKNRYFANEPPLKFLDWNDANRRYFVCTHCSKVSRQ